MSNELLLSVQQVSALLKVHPLSIRRYIKDGKLKAVRVGGNVRIPESSVANFQQDIYPTSYGTKKAPRANKDNLFSLDDPIFRLKGRGLSLKASDF